jgi:hypothetical protein
MQTWRVIRVDTPRDWERMDQVGALLPLKAFKSLTESPFLRMMCGERNSGCYDKLGEFSTASFGGRGGESIEESIPFRMFSLTITICRDTPRNDTKPKSTYLLYPLTHFISNHYFLPGHTHQNHSGKSTAKTSSASSTLMKSCHK